MLLAFQVAHARARPLVTYDFVAALPEGAHVYACGPAGLLAAYEAATAALPRQRVHLERFASNQEAATEGGFTVKLARDGRSVPIAKGRSILDALIAIGIEPPIPAATASAAPARSACSTARLTIETLC